MPGITMSKCNVRANASSTYESTSDLQLGSFVSSAYTEVERSEFSRWVKQTTNQISTCDDAENLMGKMNQNNSFYFFVYIRQPMQPSPAVDFNGCFLFVCLSKEQYSYANMLSQ